MYDKKHLLENAFWKIDYKLAVVIRYNAEIVVKHEQGQQLWIVITMGTNKSRQTNKQGCALVMLDRFEAKPKTELI